ncbi:hypothetical protein ACO1MN_16025, partial [Staphylococcus aureus]
ALTRIQAAGDPERLGPDDHAKFCKDSHTVQGWCNADGLRTLLAENEALRACAIKYLGWLDVENPARSLEQDIVNPEMICATP